MMDSDATTVGIAFRQQFDSINTLIPLQDQLQLHYLGDVCLAPEGKTGKDQHAPASSRILMRERTSPR